MLIREVTVENFRKFRAPVRIAGFSPGLNLVCEANETGKSTVLEAVRAAFFERHGAKSERIKSFRPHGDEVAPTVTVVFEVAGETWTVIKQFLQHPSVSLTGPMSRHQSDEAEEKLQSLLGFARAGNRGADDDSRGALGLLWVEQGQSFVLGTPGQTARRTLEDVLAGEVGAVTGGRRTLAVVQAVERALTEFLTPTGKPTRRLLEAQQRAGHAEQAFNEAQAELRQFDEVLGQLEAKRGELRRVVRDLGDAEVTEAANVLRADLDRARLAAERLHNAQLLFERAAGETRAQTQVETRVEERARLELAATSLARAQAKANEHGEVLSTAKSAETSHAKALEQARKDLAKAELSRESAVRAQLAADRTRALQAAFARLDRCEAIAEALVAQATIIKAEAIGPEQVERLDQLDRAVLDARSACEAGAAVIEVRLEPGTVEVRVDGAVLQGNLRRAVAHPLSLVIEGVGRIDVTPPATGEAAAVRLRTAEQDLAALLAKTAYADVGAARAGARRCREAEAEHKALEARLSGECPADSALGLAAGLLALRAGLADIALPSPDEADDAALKAAALAADSELQAARGAEKTALGRRDGSAEALQAAQLTEVRLAGLLDAAKADHDRTAAELTAAEQQVSDEALGEALRHVSAAETLANDALTVAQRAAEGLDPTILARRLETTERRRQSLFDAQLELAQTLARLEEQTKTLGAAGPAAGAQAAEEASDLARTDAARLAEEAAVLHLLKTTIDAAQAEASRRYLAPITERVAPYIRRLLPNASLAFGEDLRPSWLIRGGVEEAADDLSKGTQEQIAVLTRLAFADLLLARGKPASLVLDDALVFADDDRFETMTEILTEAASRMQVIILSCRTSAYRHVVEATRLTLER
jgi:hypothetical protein